jgi:PBP1b-binding outer membrane lipoprotein LpoB
MRSITPLLFLSALLLAGCPQVTKTSNAPSSPAPPKTLAKASATQAPQRADPIAKKPQVTYFAFKG